MGDVKRSDIASTAKEYAKAHFWGRVWVADFITSNPYMGNGQQLLIWIIWKRRKELSFRTSNEGAKDIRNALSIKMKPLYFKVGDGVKKILDELTSECGYSPWIGRRGNS